MISIESLSFDSIEKACDLANEIFSNRVVPPSHALEASLDDNKYMQFKRELFEEHEISLVDLNYWVAVESETHRIVGLIGLYSTEDDHNIASWISWFCVDRETRRKQVGQNLLKFVVRESRKNLKSYLRLFTSTDPNEAAAQILYKNMGFRIMDEKGRKKRGDFEIFYRELQLD